MPLGGHALVRQERVEATSEAGEGWLTVGAVVEDGGAGSWRVDEDRPLNELLNSEPLGRLGNGVTTMSVPLPGDARRYPFIDIALQPPGAVFDSGDSILRAANPLFTKAR